MGYTFNPFTGNFDVVNASTTSLAASAVTVTPTGNISSTDVQAALVEHQGDIDTINTRYSSGTLAQMVAATGVTGELFYNTTYSTLFRWSVDRWLPASIDPRYGFSVFDEFLSTSSPSQLAWASNGAGSLGLSGLTGVSSGVFFIEQATASARSTLSLFGASISFNAADFYIEAMVCIPTLATVGEDFCATFGFNDNLAFDANGACTDGAYITLNRAVNGSKWITNTSSNTTKTSTNTTVANITAGTWYRLGILVSQSNSNVTFYQNGTLMATHTTNIPSGVTRATGVNFKLDKIAGTAASDLLVDYFYMYGFFSSARTT